MQLNFRILISLKHLKVSAKHFITICIAPVPLSHFQNASTAHAEERTSLGITLHIIHEDYRLFEHDAV